LPVAESAPSVTGRYSAVSTGACSASSASPHTLAAASSGARSARRPAATG